MSSSLEFGLFHEFPRRPGQSETAAFAEAFELCEYGRQPGKDELRKLFPFAPEK